MFLMLSLCRLYSYCYMSSCMSIIADLSEDKYVLQIRKEDTVQSQLQCRAFMLCKLPENANRRFFLNKFPLCALQDMYIHMLVI